MESTPQVKSQPARVLSLVALIAVVLAIVALVGAYAASPAILFIAPPFLTGAAAGLGFIALLAWFAAADVERFRILVIILIVVFVTGAVAFVALLFGTTGAGHTVELLGGAVLSIVVALALVWSLRAARTGTDPWSPWIPDKPVTTWERIGQGVLALLGVVLVIGAVGQVLVAFYSPAASSIPYQQPLGVGLSAAAFAAFGITALLAAANIRSHAYLISLLITGTGIALAAILAHGRGDD